MQGYKQILIYEYVNIGKNRCRRRASTTTTTVNAVVIMDIMDFQLPAHMI
jgi:hypothetical protein